RRGLPVAQGRRRYHAAAARALIGEDKLLISDDTASQCEHARRCYGFEKEAVSSPLRQRADHKLTSFRTNANAMRLHAAHSCGPRAPRPDGGGSLHGKGRAPPALFVWAPPPPDGRRGAATEPAAPGRRAFFAR